MLPEEAEFGTYDSGILGVYAVVRVIVRSARSSTVFISMSSQVRCCPFGLDRAHELQHADLDTVLCGSLMLLHHRSSAVCSCRVGRFSVVDDMTHASANEM